MCIYTFSLPEHMVHVFSYVQTSRKVYVISMIILINIAHAGQNWGAARVHGSTLKRRNLG